MWAYLLRIKYARRYVDSVVPTIAFFDNTNVSS